MNEQRAQAYVNLIEQLLTSADDEELNKILQANQELIDPEFLQVMENYAMWLEEQGNNNPAAWLRDIKYRILLCRSLKHDLYDYLIDCHSSLTYNHGKLNQESENETGTYSENFSRR